MCACGGTCALQFNNKVNYVVCDGLSTAKYNLYSKKRNLVVVRPAYILKCAEKKELLPVTEEFSVINNN